MLPITLQMIHVFTKNSLDKHMRIAVFALYKIRAEVLERPARDLLFESLTNDIENEAVVPLA
jgi:hypothetical protein